MSDILDTMNELAEKKEDHNMDVWADMAPPPRGWDTPNRTPPPPPEPPPGRLSCSSCGYTAPEPEFKKNHPRCVIGMLKIAALVSVIVSIWIIIAIV